MNDERLSVAAARLQFLASHTSLLRDSECVEELRAIVVDCRRWAATGNACQLRSQGVLKLLLLLVSAPVALPTAVRLNILQTMANAMASAPEMAPFFVEELQKPQLLGIISHSPGEAKSILCAASCGLFLCTSPTPPLSLCHSASVLDVLCYLLYLCCKADVGFVDRMPCVVHELAQIKSMVGNDVSDLRLKYNISSNRNAHGCGIIQLRYHRSTSGPILGCC